MYKGSLRKKTDMIKYELDIKENKLYRLKYIIDENGRKRAKYKPTCVYFDAINDTNAIRKANKTIYSIKVGCRIDNVSENE
ncbi:MAG: hypothetical protein LBB41_07390 [Prevotellaceae bacterium]|nr:hypothetical protein [Prevotellaceae bacterium]